MLGVALVLARTYLCSECLLHARSKTAVLDGGDNVIGSAAEQSSRLDESSISRSC